MAELKTKENDGSVSNFIEGIADAGRKADCLSLLGIMQELSGAAPRMWGDSMVGFGTYRYRYATGREGDWFKVGFSPRKQALTLYLMAYQWDKHPELMDKLGKYELGKGCLYIKKLSDVDEAVLRELITLSVKHCSA